MGVDFSALSGYGFGVSLEDVDLFDVAQRTGYELREYEIEDRIVDDAWDLANHLCVKTVMGYMPIRCGT